MDNVAKWYEDESFWHNWAPSMFPPQRITRTSAEVDQVLSLVNVQPGSRILDLCCGPGRHSLELARRGYKVTGVDRTVEYLDRAKQQAVGEGLRVEFVPEDMRDFRRPDTFDLAINMYTSFGYFEGEQEDRKVVGNIFSSLKAGGAALIDLMGKEVLARVYKERDWHETEQGVFRLEERHVDDDWSRMRARWIQFGNGQHLESTLNHRLYSASELKSLLREVGFGDVHAYGGLDGSPYDHRATRLVVVGHKNASMDFEI